MPCLQALQQTGERVDFTGDEALNDTCATRRHNGIVGAWTDCLRASATAPVILGDKDNKALTKAYNDGHVQGSCSNVGTVLAHSVLTALQRGVRTF